MQNNKKVIRCIGKIQGSKGEATTMYDDGTITYFKGNMKTGTGSYSIPVQFCTAVKASHVCGRLAS